MESLKKTIFVKYKNPDGTHTAEARRPFIEIIEDRFQPKYHRKLIFRNFIKDKFADKKWDINNPWIVVVVGGVLVGIILYLLLP